MTKCAHRLTFPDLRPPAAAGRARLKGKGPRRGIGAALPVQHLQGLQVQGLQRHPPLAAAGAGVAAGLVSTVLFIGFLLGLPSGESVYSLSTMVRSQAA